MSSLVDVDSPHISSVPSDYESQSVKTDTQAARQEREEEIKEAAKEIRDSAAAKKDKAKDKVRKNADNPVVLSNAVGLAVVAAALSFGAYRKHSRGELTGKVVAAWAGVVGLFGLGDYYVSQSVTPPRAKQTGRRANFCQILLQALPSQELEHVEEALDGSATKVPHNFN